MKERNGRAMEWEEKPRKCEGYEALLEDSLEGALSGEDAKRLESHLHDCVSCREALENAKQSRRLLQWGEPAAEASPGFARIVMARIRANEEQAASEAGLLQTLVTFASRLAITATLALGVLIAYAAVAPPAPSVQTASMSAAGRYGLFTDPAQRAMTRDDFLRMVAETSYGQK